MESPPTSVARRKPPENVSRRGSRVGETAGECAAVCCCCPCALGHLLILAVYHLPRGIWRKKKRKIFLRKNSSEEKDFPRRISPSGFSGDDDRDSTAQNDADDEIWDRLGAGFWRSGSPRKDACFFFYLGPEQREFSTKGRVDKNFSYIWFGLD